MASIVGCDPNHRFLLFLFLVLTVVMILFLAAEWKRLFNLEAVAETQRGEKEAEVSTKWDEEEKEVEDEAPSSKWNILKEAVADLYDVNIQHELSRSCEHRSHPVQVFKSDPNNERFNCDPYYERHRPLPEGYMCGVKRVFDHPYLWECRLKSRIMDILEDHDLREVPFLVLDIGSLRADWVLSIGLFAPYSRFITFEPSNAFHELYPDLQTNPNSDFSSRVFGFQAAAASHVPYEQYYDAASEGTNNGGILLTSSDQVFNKEDGWKGPLLCINLNNTDGVAKTSQERKGSQTCLDRQSSIPALPIDLVIQGLSPHRVKRKSLLYAKVDVEGAEYEALLGANSTLSSPDTRPCIVFIEIKMDYGNNVIPSYDKAYRLLTEEYGYTDIFDVDSKKEGSDSYPPTGSLLDTPLEGNYDLRLPPDEMKNCIDRVKTFSKSS